MDLPAFALGPLSLTISNGTIANIIKSAAAIIVAGIFFRLFGQFIRRVGRFAGVRTSTDRAVRDAMSILWITTSAVAVLTIWNLTSQFGVLTLSGIAGLVVSLALQSTLGNIIAGVFLLRDQLLRIGDEVEYNGIRGTIIRVAMRNTWILTKDGTVAVVGNTSLASGPLINHSASKAFAVSFGGGMAPVVVPPAPSAGTPGPTPPKAKR